MIMTEWQGGDDLTTETIKGTALSLQCVNDVKGSDSLALGVLSVCNSITDDTLEESLQNTTGFFVDHCDKTRQQGNFLKSIEHHGH